MPITMIHFMEPGQIGVQPYTLGSTVLDLDATTDGIITIDIIDGIPGITGMIHGMATIDGMIHGETPGDGDVVTATTVGIHPGATIDGTMVGTIDGMATTTALPATEEIIYTPIIMTEAGRPIGDHDVRDQLQHLHADR